MGVKQVLRKHRTELQWGLDELQTPKCVKCLQIQPRAALVALDSTLVMLVFAQYCTRWHFLGQCLRLGIEIELHSLKSGLSLSGISIRQKDVFGSHFLFILVFLFVPSLENQQSKDTTYFVVKYCPLHFTGIKCKV